MQALICILMQQTDVVHLSYKCLPHKKMTTAILQSFQQVPNQRVT